MQNTLQKKEEQVEGFFPPLITRSKALDVIRRRLESGQLRVVWHHRVLSQWGELQNRWGKKWGPKD